MMWRLWKKKPRSVAVAEAANVLHDLWVVRAKLAKDILKIARMEKRLKIVTDQQRIVTQAMAEDIAEYRQNIESAQREAERAERALELLRQENKVLGDVVVPALTSGIESVQERWNADIALSGLKKAAASPRTEEEY